MNRARLSHILAITAQIHKVTLAYFLFISLMFSTLASQMQQPVPQLRAAVCSLPTTIDSTIEITPTNEDNIIDCSSQNITITATGKLILKSVVTANDSIADDKGVHLKVGNLTVENGGEISSSGQGYSVGSLDASNGVLGSATASTGTAAGSGGGHGGAGGSGNTSGGDGVVLGSTGSSFGQLETPSTLGGAGAAGGTGGAGGIGGGAMRIEASGTVTVNGSIVADGLSGVKSGDGITAGGGGAGGSIWIQADTLAGTGIVSAKGGNSDNTATFAGGGGGGGRVVLLCNTATSLSPVNVSVAYGTGSQNGGIGTLVGPGCKPADPTVLRLFESSTTAGKVDRAMEAGDLTSKTSLTFASNLPSENLRLEIEVRKQNEVFLNVLTAGQATAASNKSCTDLPTSNGVTISMYCGNVSVTGLDVSTEYKWQARLVNASGIPSNWVQIGTNSDTDFTVVGAPVSIINVAGDNQSVIAGQKAAINPKARVVDAAGYGVPFYSSFAWSIVTGGGAHENGTLVADKWGELTAEWTVGTTAGINNNSLKISRTSTPKINTTFVASVVPAAIHHYKVVVPSTILLTGTSFTYTIQAQDQFNNAIGFVGDVTAVPVNANNTAEPALGSLTPSNISLPVGSADPFTVNNDPYTYSENIRIKVYDANGREGYSSAVLFINSLGACPAITIDADQTWNAQDVSGGVFDCRGLGTLTITNGATLSLRSYDNGDTNWNNDYGVTILADSFDVQAGAKISATALGYQSGRGPGGTPNTTYASEGASHGGYGTTKAPYGDVYEPTTLGSGGGGSIYCTARAGGGAMKLVSTGSIRNDGTVVSDGEDHDGGAGGQTACQHSAGGSIWVVATTLEGNGTYQANASPHRGGGGRIALYYADPVVLPSAIAPKVQAFGGATAGGPGTVYIQNRNLDAERAGHLFVDNNSRNLSYAGLIGGDYSFASINLTRFGHVDVVGNTSVIRATNGSALKGDSTKPLLKVGGTFVYEGTGVLTLDGIDLGINGKIVGVNDFDIGGTNAAGVTLYANTWWYNASNTHSFDTMNVKGNGVLTMVPYRSGTTNWSQDYGVKLAVNNLAIEAGGKLTSSGQGYAAVMGPGAGTSSTYDGYAASHGGYAELSEVPYGDLYEPITQGSAGGNKGPFCTSGSGGGAFKVIVTGVLQNDGVIDANASAANCNNGAGGSVWLDVNTITGVGKIEVNGATDASHGGSGGRLALYYAENQGFNVNNTGLTAFGGAGAGPGTIYIEQKGVNATRQGKLLVDHNNRTNQYLAGVLEGTYSFSAIQLLREGGVEFIGQNSSVTVTDGSGMLGDNTMPLLKASGTFNYAGTGVLKVDGIDLGINGKATGITDLEIGGTNAGGVTLYAKTWWYNSENIHSYGSVLVKNNGVLTLTPYINGTTTWALDYGTKVNFNNLTVESGGVVNSDGLGYGTDFGPGKGYPGKGGGAGARSGGPAAYGGHSNGNVTYSNPGNFAYGDAYEPISLGSGGGAGNCGVGGSGGGAMQLTIANALVNNGMIRSNAGAVGCLNGSGGSVFLNTTSISGTGKITANGGTSTTRGGSGGRISVYYSTNEGFDLSTNSINAFGGSDAGPGTVYLEQKGVDAVKNGLLIVDNNNVNKGFSAGLTEEQYSFKLVKLIRYGNLEVMGDNSVLRVGSGDGLQGDSTKPLMKVTGTFDYTGAGALTIDGINLGINGKVVGVNDFIVGGTSAAGLTLYAQTWWYNYETTHQFNSIRVKSNGTVALTPYVNTDAVWTNEFGVTLTLNELTVDQGGVLHSNGLGYPADSGPGAGFIGKSSGAGARSGGPASHGGYSAGQSDYGHAIRVPYGDALQPIMLGSGGGTGNCGAGATGGGAYRLVVAGRLENNGVISSDGSTAGCNNGAGGSIIVDTTTLAGIGRMSVNGSTATTWGAAGGRIAVYYQQNEGFALSPTGLQAFSGVNGGAGTVYVEQKGIDQPQKGKLMIDNNNRSTNKWTAGLIEGNYAFKQIALTRYGHLEIMGDGSKLTAASGSIFTGDNTKPLIKLSGTFTYEGTEKLLIDGVDLGFNGKVEGVDDIEIGGTNAAGVTLYAQTWWHNKTTPHQFGDVLVKSNGILTTYPYSNTNTDFTDDYGVTLNTQNLTIDAGGLVTASGIGYANDIGPGKGFYGKDIGAGAGPGGPALHAGLADGSTDLPYGNLYQPATLGSGGGGGNCGLGGAGGGALKLVVANTLLNNGAIRADAATTGCNNGAGGSLWIDTVAIDGTGEISARGSTNTTRGGSGGRVAVYFNQNNGFSFAQSKVNALGTPVAGPGTVYYEQRNVHRVNGGNLVIANNGVAQKGDAFRLGQEYKFNDVTIGQGVTISVLPKTETPVLGATSDEGATSEAVVFDVTGTFTLEAGATIDATGKGYAPAAGPGAGSVGVGYSGGGGGANGGDGGQGQGDGVNTPAAGGLKSGDQLQPITLGSGGGNSGAGALGGYGGGAIAIIARGIRNEEGQFIQGHIDIKGTIRADGTAGLTGSPGGGGGAGGSILLHGNTCDISGTLSAQGGEGGNSDVDGGSGGGGRVSILYNSGPCDVTANVSVSQGVSSDPANYSAQSGQTGTYPAEPNSVPWPSQYREQFEVKPATQGATTSNVVYAFVRSKTADVLGATESVIPVGGVINGTTVTLKADAYDAGASISAPKHLKIQIEIKKIDQLFDGLTGVHDSETILFSGGSPVVLSVQIANLDMGSSYKWRVRTVNTDNSLESEWLDFGENAGNVPDFTITTVAALDMQSPQTTIEFSEYGTVTVAALNSVGEVDTTYRGTIRFRSDSTTAQLPDNYTFAAGDNGQHTFTNGIKFFESGNFAVTVEDTVNGTLIDSLVFTVNAPRIPFLALGASSTTVLQGESTTLQWQSSYISNLSINNELGAVSTTGSMSVTPLATTTYIITGTNEQNEQMTSSVTITVDEVEPTISLNAIPSTIANGNSVMLAWNSEYLTDLTIDNGIGSVGATGSLVIYPSATTTYEISGKSIVDETYKTSVTVTVNNLVGTISFSASATQVIKGNSTLLQWETTNLTNVSIDNGVGSVSATGTREVSPTSSTTYVITGQNIQTGETMSRSILIIVVPVPNTATLTISASASTIQVGKSVTLQWQSALLTNLTINNNVGSVSANGTKSVSPGSTTIYTISGQKSDGTTMQASVQVTVAAFLVPKTPAIGISASASKIKIGESITLQWQSANVTELSISAGVGAVGATGTKTVTPITTTTYEIIGKTETGTIIKAAVTVQVTKVIPSSPYVDVCPVIVDFKVNANLIKKGEEFTISWQVKNADKVSIDVFGSNLVSSGSAVLSLQKSQDITIFASKGSCQKLQSKHVDVVSAYPWEGAGGLLIGVIAIEAVSLQFGMANGNLWLAIAGLIDRAKKRSPWGVVYNALNKKLVGRAIIRLWDTKNGKLVDTVVSDANGVFKLTPRPGQYVIKVTHPEFTYPTKLVSGDTDSGYSNVYTGEVIEVKSEQEILTFSIPLDPIKKSKSELFSHYVANFVDELIALLSPVIIIAGFIYGIVVTFLYPIAINYVIVGIYALLIVLKAVVYLSRPRVYGTVSGVDGKIISGLELGLFDKEFNTLISKTFTNKKGGYNFIVKNQDYYLRILDDKYKILSKNPSKEGYLIKKLAKFSGGVRLITENLMVYPLKK